MSEAKATKNEKRETARENARLARAQEQKRKARNRIITQLSIVIGVLAVAVITVSVVLSGAGASNSENPKNMASDGAVVAQGLTVQATAAIKGNTPIVTEQSKTKANIVIYLDYLCPYCGQFEKTNTAELESLVNSGAATVEYHPIAILSEYSARAANAAACVVDSDPKHFWAYNTALFVNQPAEAQTGGLPNKELITLAGDVGVDRSLITSCVNNGTFSKWVTNSTQRATGKAIPNSKLAKVSSTPTVLVDGQQFTGNPLDAKAFKTFVADAIAKKQVGK